MRVGTTIYLDHQATTPTDSRVLEAMSPYFTSAFGNPHSADHVVGWRSARAVEEAASVLALVVGADADEIVFTSGATEANNLALLGFARRSKEKLRRRILCSAIEHKSVLAAGKALHNLLGYQLELIPVDRNGHIILSDLISSLSDDVLLVSVMLVNNEIGTIQDIPRIAAATAQVGAVFHCDASQAPCAIDDLHVIAPRADLLSLSAHKMYGPQGIGALVIRRELQDQIEPLIYGGGQQNNLRSGTTPVALCVGMARAAELLGQPEAHQERARIKILRDKLINQLIELSWPVELNGCPTNRHPGNASIRFVGLSAHEILGALQPYVAASTGSACTSGIPEPSHVLRAIGLTDAEADASIRFSLGRNTEAADIDEAVAHIARAISTLPASRCS